MKNQDPSEEALQRIVEAHWSYSSGGPELHKVRFFTRYAHDAVNFTLNGELEVDGEMYGFTIDDGNWNGTVVREWGLTEDVGRWEPETPDPFALLPIEPRLRLAMLKVYFLWREAAWFKEMEKSWAYDRHFASGLKTEGYWRPKAAQRGLRDGRLSEVKELERVLASGGFPEPISLAEIEKLWIETEANR